MFLDDDDHLLHNKVLQEIVEAINKVDEDTMFIWQMRYPNGKVLPSKEHFKLKQIEMGGIGSPCFIFHSKYKKFAQWDEWKVSDFRIICKLHEIIPKKKWIGKVYIQINNYGDFGNRNDILTNVTNKMIYHKSWFWILIPKYHFQLKSIFIFQIKTYKKYWMRSKVKIKKICNMCFNLLY
jgi:hypothetical protein